MSNPGLKDLDLMIIQCEEIISRLKVHLHPVTVSDPEQPLVATLLDRTRHDIHTASLLSQFYSYLHDVLVKIPEQSHFIPLSIYLNILKMENIAANQRDLRISTHLPPQFFHLVPLVRYAHHVAKATQNEHLSVCIAAPLLTLALGIAYSRVLTENALLLSYIHDLNVKDSNPLDIMIVEGLSEEVNDTLGSLAIIASLVAPTLLPEYGMRNPTSAPDSDTTPDATTAPEYPLPLWVPVALAQLFELSTLMQWAVAAKTRALRTVKSDEEQIAAALANKSAPAPVSHDKDEFAPALFLLEKAHDVWRYLPAAFTPTAADAMEARLRVASADASVVAALPVPLSPVPLPFTPFQPHHLPETALHALAAAAAARDRARAQAEAKSEAVEGQQEAEADAAVKEHAQLSVDTDVWTSCPPAGLYLYALLSLLCVPATLSWLDAELYSATASSLSSTTTTTTASSSRTDATLSATSGGALRRRWAVRMAYIIQAKVHTQLLSYLASQAACYLWSYVPPNSAKGDTPHDALRRSTSMYRSTVQVVETLKSRLLKLQKEKVPSMSEIQECKARIDEYEKKCAERRTIMMHPTNMLPTPTPSSTVLFASLACSFTHLFARMLVVNIPHHEHKALAAFLPRWPILPLHALHTPRLRKHTLPLPLPTSPAASSDDNLAFTSALSPLAAALPKYSPDAHAAYLAREEWITERIVFALYVLQLRVDILWSLSADTTMLLAMAWACARRVGVAYRPALQPWFDSTHALCMQNSFTPYLGIMDLFPDGVLPLCLPSHAVPNDLKHAPPPTTLKSLIIQQVYTVLNDARAPLQSVANPLHHLPFVPTPSLLTQEQADLMVLRGDNTPKVQPMPLVLLVIAKPELCVWLTGPSATNMTLELSPLLSTLLAHVGYAHLSRGAWACVEQRMHAQLTQPLQPAEDVRVRDAIGLAAPRTRTHVQLPLYAVPEGLTDMLKAHTDNCYGIHHDIIEGERPRTLVTLPLLAFAPTAALVPPLLALLCAASPPQPSQFLASPTSAEAAFKLLHQLATAVAPEEDLGAVEYTENPASGVGVFKSAALEALDTKSSVLVYRDPIFSALEQTYTFENKTTQLSALSLQALLTQVGLLTLASSNTPRLSEAEMERLQKVELVAPTRDLLTFASLQSANASKSMRAPTPILPLEHCYAACLAAEDARESAPSLVNAVMAHNTPLQPSAANLPTCPRCGNTQVPALTFMCIARDAGSNAPATKQGKTSAKSDDKVTEAEDILYFAHPATTCLTCFPSSLPQAEALRRALLAGCGAVVSIAGADADAIQQGIITKAQKQIQPVATKTTKGVKLPAKLLKTKTASVDVPSVLPEREALTTNPGLRLCLRFSDMAHVKPSSSIQMLLPSGAPLKDWAVRWLFDSMRLYGNRRVRTCSTKFPYRATMRMWAGGNDPTTSSTMLPPAALSPHFPTLDLGSLVPARTRAAAVNVALTYVSLLKTLNSKIDVMLLCRDSMATMLLAHAAENTVDGGVVTPLTFAIAAATATTTTVGDGDGAAAKEAGGKLSHAHPFSFSRLSLHALVGYMPERVLVVEPDETQGNVATSLDSAPFLEYMLEDCTCTLSESGKSRELSRFGKLFPPEPFASSAVLPSASCPKHASWFSAMPALLRALIPTPTHTMFDSHTSIIPPVFSLDQLKVLDYTQNLLSTPNLPAAISLSLLAHALRVCAAMVPDIITCLAAPARASALVLRTVAALNALNAALPATVFGPGGRPQPLRVDMLAAAAPVGVLIGRELECLRTALTVVQRIVATHTLEAQAEAEAKAKAEAEAKAGTDAAAVGAPEVNAEPAPETQGEAAAKAAVSARPAAAGAVPVSGALLPEPLLHCAATLAQSLPLVVLATFFGALSDTAVPVSEALEDCAVALVHPVEDPASTVVLMQTLAKALRELLPESEEGVIKWLFHLRDGPRQSSNGNARSIYLECAEFALVFRDDVSFFITAATYPVVFSAAMHAEQHLRLVLTPHVHMPARVLAEQHTPQTPAAAQVRVVNELHDTVVCHVTPSMAVDIVSTAPRAVPVSTLCAWLDHLRLACCRTHEAAAAISAKPAATLVAAAAPEADTGAEATKAEAEGVAVAAPPSAPADAWQCVWDWLLSVRRAHVHTLAREYATHGAAQVLLRRLPPPARASMACYDTLPHTPPADVSELSATEVPTLSQVPVHAQTWVLLCTRMWNDAAQQWARSVALGALCQLAPGLRGRTSEAIAAAAARQPACFDAFMRSSAHKTFAALAVAAGLRGVRVPGLMAQAARASTKWQGAYDPLLFPCPSAAPHVRAVSADAVFAPTHATLRDRTMDVSRYTVSVSLPCVPEYTPVPVPEWQQVKPNKPKASEDTKAAQVPPAPPATMNPFGHRLLAGLYREYIQFTTASLAARPPKDPFAPAIRSTSHYTTPSVAALDGMSSISDYSSLDSDDDPYPSRSAPASARGRAAAGRGGAMARGNARVPSSSTPAPSLTVMDPEILSDECLFQSTSDMDIVD